MRRKSRKKYSNRALHRDFGYFFSGLIMSFALSGIIMNHRAHWHPEKISLQVTPIEIQLPAQNKIDKHYVDQLVRNSFKLEDHVRRHFIRKNKLKISCKNHDVEIDLTTGKGELIRFINTPLISQSITLHKSTSNFWIIYSDIFGGALIFIVITGLLINKKGRFTFAKRGWWIALLGLAFPILFLIL